MKKIIVLVILLIIIGLSVFLIYNKVLKNQEIKDAYSSIPSFQIPNLQGNIVTEKSLSPEKSTLFLFFDPECGNCEEEFLQIKAKRDSLPDCQMFFVSTLPADTILNFLERIDFQPTENMFFLCDSKAEISETMNVKGVPSALIYDKTSKLIKFYAGQVKAETLIKYLSD
jgi:thioredoxin-related protein